MQRSPPSSVSRPARARASRKARTTLSLAPPAAAPPPMRPLMPCLAMKSSARWLALVREGPLVERLEDDVDLLLEELAVGVLVEHRPPEGLDLARMVAAPDA